MTTPSGLGGASRRLNGASLRTVAGRPKRSSSSGTGRPSACTGVVESAITTNRAAAAATIFSRVWAPPPPLTSQPSGAIWSAPSIAMSSRASSPNGSTGRPSASAARSVAGEVATQRSASRRRARTGSSRATVEPVPSPTAMPLSTSSAAAAAARPFSRSVLTPTVWPPAPAHASRGARGTARENDGHGRPFTTRAAARREAPGQCRNCRGGTGHGGTGAGRSPLGGNALPVISVGRIAASVPLGFLIGLSLGSLGGGGSILAVPALVYGAGESAHAATTTSLVVVGATALAGMAGHLRAGRVRFWSGLGFGLVGIAGSFLGSLLNRDVPGDVLLLAFSGLIVAAAWRMRRRQAGTPRRAGGGRHDRTPGRPPAGPPTRAGEEGAQPT